MKDLGLDGLDIDWEYPRDSTEAENFVLLLQETRRALDAYTNRHGGGHRLMLTIACPAGPQNYKKLHLKAMDKHLDFWNLMSYDYAGSWDSFAGHQANILPSSSNPSSTPFSTSDAIAYYKSHGISPHKIVLGMPLYGRAFTSTDGPGKPFSGAGEGSWEPGVWDYKALPQNGAEEMFDKEVGASWSYDGGKRLMVSYDNKEMARRKVDYIRAERLGGAMWWESSADKQGGDSLIATVRHHALKPAVYFIC